MSKTGVSLVVVATTLAATSLLPFFVSANDVESQTLQELSSQIVAIQGLLNQLAAAKDKTTAKPGSPPGKPVTPGKPQPTPPAQAPSSQPATPATPVSPAQPSLGTGTPAVRATPAVPAQPGTVISSPQKEGLLGDDQRQTIIKGIQDKIRSLQAQINDVSKSSPAVARGLPGAQPISVLPDVPRITSNLQRGSSGESTNQLQGFLKKFPDLYPDGEVSGFFGPKTEAAVKRLQEKFGLEVVGNVGPKTRAKLSELSAAIERKKTPKISDITPSSPFIGSAVTISGSGFTLDGNSVFIRGRVVASKLAAVDGTEITFTLPFNTPCRPEIACPIKVINRSGISNAKPIRLVVPPTPEPPPEPSPTPAPTSTPTPTPTPTPVKEPPKITSITPSVGPIGTRMLITGSSFTVADNAINFSGVNDAVTGLGSADGTTLAFNIPNVSACQPVAACAVSVTNANGTSNTISITVSQVATPVVIVAPNGGEQWVQGAAGTIRWTGGKDIVRVALAEGGAVSGTDPAGFIVGWVSTSSAPGGSTAWDGRKVCDEAGATCFSVDPGTYKALAVSENELGNAVINSDGSGNWDVSDAAFTILPSPTLTVISPNGGEKLVHGASVTISWNATTISSRAVNVNLLKSGAFYRAIASAVPQSQDNGIFFTPWTVPADIPAAGDYTVEVSDAANPAARDASDAPFTIAVGSTISVLAPNGGESWVAGFQGTVKWSSGNITSNTVNVNLFKAGVFYRTLAANVLQTYYSWQTTGYASGVFTKTVVIPVDLPAGNDYTIEVANAADATVRDASDAPFGVNIVPDPVTFSGRFIDQFTKQPMVNTWLNLQGGSYAYTNTNGEFSVTKSTAGVTQTAPRTIYASWPNCYMLNFHDMRWKPENLSVYGYIFDLIGNAFTPITSAQMPLGSVQFWPATGLNVNSDVLMSRVTIPYSEEGAWVMSGSATPKAAFNLDKALALNYDLRAEITDTAGVKYAVPSLKVDLANGCAAKTITFANGQAKWEPYTINIGPTYYPTSGTVGTSYSFTLTASGGTSSYTWGLLAGTLLPPGVALNSSTGAISGVPTTVGTYEFAVGVTDASGVRGGRTFQVQIR